MILKYQKYINLKKKLIFFRIAFEIMVVPILHGVKIIEGFYETLQRNNVLKHLGESKGHA